MMVRRALIRRTIKPTERPIIGSSRIDLLAVGDDEGVDIEEKVVDGVGDGVLFFSGSATMGLLTV